MGMMPGNMAQDGRNASIGHDDGTNDHSGALKAINGGIEIDGTEILHGDFVDRVKRDVESMGIRGLARSLSVNPGLVVYVANGGHSVALADAYGVTIRVSPRRRAVGRDVPADFSRAEAELYRAMHLAYSEVAEAQVRNMRRGGN